MLENLNQAHIYPVYLTDSLQQIDFSSLLKKYAQIVIITDDNVAALHAQKIQNKLQNIAPCTVLQIKAHEQSKSRATKAWLEDELLALGCGKDTLLVSLGGGMVSDLTGFVAATFYRGVDVIYIATSLMAMIDAALGGKCGINLAQGKNLLGVIREPQAVILSLDLLETLSDSEYHAAFAEMIKHAIIYDAEYYQYLFNHADLLLQRAPHVLLNAIKKSVQIKLQIVAQDKFEQGIRAILNYGHSIAHAIEKISNYSLSHGKAVAIGILIEAHIAHSMHLLDKQALQAIQDILRKFNFNTMFLQDYESIVQALRLDKKNRDNKIKMALPCKIGKMHYANNCYTHAISLKIIQQSLCYI